MATHFLVAETWLGHLLLAGGPAGVRWISLGDDAESLEGELRAALPDAEAAPDDGQLAAWRDALLAHLDGALPDLDLPLDTGGSLFQRRVWWALRAIPYGQTRSYGDIARTLGADTAPRAVARACASNTMALVIPCHRAVGQSGDLTGFRWGLHRKRLLLERERQLSGGSTQLALL